MRAQQVREKLTDVKGQNKAEHKCEDSHQAAAVNMRALLESFILNFPVQLQQTKPNSDLEWMYCLKKNNKRMMAKLHDPQKTHGSSFHL